MRLRILFLCLGAAAITGALLATLSSPARGASAPTVTISASPSGSTATITYTINRAANQVASRSCSLTDPTTSTAGTACGSQTGSTKTSTTYQVSPTNLTPGNYSFTVKFTLTDGGKATGSKTFTIPKLPQTITIISTNPSPVTVGETYMPTATSDSGLPVAISLDASSSGCSLSGGLVSFTAAGTCQVDFNQSGNTTYDAASQKQQSITVNKKSQTITITSTNPSPVTVGDSYTPTATSDSGLPVAISLDGSSSGCSLSGGLVSFSAAGTCQVDFNQSGDTTTYNAATQKQQSITVNSSGKQDQTITFAATTYTSGDSYTVSATATSGLPVAFSIDASASTTCSISDTAVTFQTAGGTCVVDANQVGDPTYNAAPQVQQSVVFNGGGSPGGGGGGGCSPIKRGPGHHTPLIGSWLPGTTSLQPGPYVLSC
jgi:hypothetical protein